MKVHGQPDLFAEAQRRTATLDSIERRDSGMSRVVENAERLSAGWIESALECVRRYALTHREFLAEEIPLSEKPHDGRAMGSIMRMAAKRNYVESAGYGLALTSNHSPKKKWRSLIYQGSAA